MQQDERIIRIDELTRKVRSQPDDNLAASQDGDLPRPIRLGGPEHICGPVGDSAQ